MPVFRCGRMGLLHNKSAFYTRTFHATSNAPKRAEEKRSPQKLGAAPHACQVQPAISVPAAPPTP